MQLGTAGYGFVTISPSLANDIPFGYTTSSTFTGTTASPLTANNVYATGVTRNFMSNIPYTTLQLLTGSNNGGNVVSGRIVSCGLRITYTGTTLDQSGVYYVYTSPTHENVLATSNTISSVSSQADVDICGIGRKPCTSRIFSVSPSETAYSMTGTEPVFTNPVIYTYPYSTNDNTQNGGFLDGAGLPSVGFTLYVGSPVCVVHATGKPGSSFLIEYIQHMEYAGLATAANATVSDADQRGFEVVTAAAQRLPAIIQSTQKSPGSAMMTALAEVASALKPIAISALTSAVGAMIL
jgi:hypothetical protein